MKTQTGAMTYLTLDNGGRPFKVWFGGNNVQVYAMSDNRKLLGIKVDLFIAGTSIQTEMTEYSMGYGSRFDGNSVLFRRAGEKNQYYWVGDEVYKFQTYAEIIYFTSPVGNNSVPYPWAVDSLRNIYLFIEKQVILGNGLHKNTPITETTMPYHWVYDYKNNYTFKNPFGDGKDVVGQIDPHPERGYGWKLDAKQQHGEDDEWLGIPKERYVAIMTEAAKDDGTAPMVIITQFAFRE